MTVESTVSRPNAGKPVPPTPGAARLLAARRPLLLGFVTLALLGGGLFGWGAFASIAGAVLAAGQVEVETRDQVVEHIDGGTVGRILVKNGDRVKAGDVLVRLDGADLRSEATVLAAEAAELAARRNRLEAEFRDAETIAWDTDLLARAQDIPGVRDILDGQRRLFKARRDSRAGQKAQLEERIGQTERQIAGLRAQARAVERQRGFIDRELKVQRELFEKGLTELHQLLQLEREGAQLEGQAGDIEARIAGARGGIAEIGIQILQIGTNRVEEAEAEAREARARENEVRERLASVRARLGRMAVRAPVAGEVFAMTVFGPGEVVRPGDPILNIVPDGAGLLVRARLEPIHVDQVHAGQAAVLRFSAFPARVTPEFEGRILRVSGDASHDERTGLSWYEVEVSMGLAVQADGETAPPEWLKLLREQTADWFGEDAPMRDTAAAGLDHNAAPAAAVHAHDLALTPGMPVEVHVRTGERSPLSYLVKPLTDYFSRSMREE